MRYSIHYAVLLLIIFIGGGAAVAAKLEPTGASVPGDALVKIQPGARNDVVAALEHAGDVERSERISVVKSGTILRMHSRSLNTEALTTALAKNPNVVYAEPNYIVSLVDVPNDPSFTALWGLKNTGQNVNGSVG